MNMRIITINRKKAEIKRLIESLTAMDDKRLVNSEYVAADDPDLPYDPYELHQTSMALRGQIAALEAEIAELEVSSDG